MNNNKPITVIIISVTLLVCSLIISSGLKSLGRNIETTGRLIENGLRNQRSPSFPSKLRVDLGEVKVANGGGGGSSLRIECKNMSEKK